MQINAAIFVANVGYIAFFSSKLIKLCAMFEEIYGRYIYHIKVITKCKFSYSYSRWLNSTFSDSLFPGEIHVHLRYPQAKHIWNQAFPELLTIGNLLWHVVISYTLPLYANRVMINSIQTSLLRQSHLYARKQCRDIAVWIMHHVLCRDISVRQHCS